MNEVYGEVKPYLGEAVEATHLIETIEHHCAIWHVLVDATRYELMPTVIEDICELAQYLGEYSIKEA